MEKNKLETLIAELLGNNKISQFSVEFILTCQTANSPSIHQVYKLLDGYGLTDEKIASQAALLGRDPETIESNYQNLKKYGLTDEKIVSQAQLLGMNPETIERNYQSLKRLGLSDEKIATQAQLLGRDPETIERNYQSLKRLGLSDEKIATHAALLGRDPETIERNYNHHVALLRKDYTNRNSGRELLFNQAQLLGIPPKTIEANVQYLHTMEVDYHNPFLLGTTPQTKRKKLAWMLRELFDYRDIPREFKKDAIGRLYDFVREHPNILFRSINTLENQKENLRKNVEEYRIAA